jgi:hypothetical protein
VGVSFTQRERKRLCRQNGYGYRPRSGWGSGDLPAPWAEGDLVKRISDAADDRLGNINTMTYDEFVVAAVFSIDDGDEWYCRVAAANGEVSDRLHVISDSTDYMAAFELIDTADPKGLALREKMLADGRVSPAKEPPSVAEISQTEIRIAARKEWTKNLEMGYIGRPEMPWDEELWLDHLAARTEYIVRQLAKVNFDYDGKAQEAHRAAETGIGLNFKNEDARRHDEYGQLM